MTYFALRVLSRILKIFSIKKLHAISQNLASIFFNYVPRRKETALKNLKIKLIILECTNLSPYKRFFRNIFSGEIIDLLVLIEKKIPGIIQKEFL